MGSQDPGLFLIEVQLVYSKQCFEIVFYKVAAIVFKRRCIKWDIGNPFY